MADLVVEIVCPESRQRFFVEKYAEYEASAVSEYWILDTYNKKAEFYILNKTGPYERRFDEEGVYESVQLAGLKLPVDWVCGDMPDTMDALRQLGVIS